MGPYILGILLALILTLVVIIVIRTLQFKPKAIEKLEEDFIDLDHDKILTDMVDMIRCKTVSNREESLVDWAEFEKFQTLLKERFPLIHKACEFQKIGKIGLLYRLPGKSSEKPSVCMAHFDVVPVDESGWDKPAFEGIVEDGVLWGRGTIDTKGTLCGVMEALEYMLSKGYVPEQDLYLSFSGEEEIDGASCACIVDYFEEKGIKPNLVLDEGGAVVDNVFPGVKESCALIGIGEKGGVNWNLSMDSLGGHASTPPKHTIVGHLSKAVVGIEKNPFKCQLTKPAAEMFDTVGRYSNFLYRMIFANLWCFKPVLDFYGKLAGGELNAMLRTTVAVTRMEGSNAYNVLPPKASVGINMRLLGEDTPESAKRHLEKAIKNDKIKVEMVNGTNASIYSDTSCEAWDKITLAVRQTWTEAIVSPYLMMACSDSRHYNRISDKVYRFSAMHLTKEERGMVHGHNERIPVSKLIKTAEFYVRLLRQL